MTLAKCAKDAKEDKRKTARNSSHGDTATKAGQPNVRISFLSRAVSPCRCESPSWFHLRIPILRCRRRRLPHCPYPPLRLCCTWMCECRGAQDAREGPTSPAGEVKRCGSGLSKCDRSYRFFHTECVDCVAVSVHAEKYAMS
jgi:hypothetical protein